jgi:hypothetical protein
MKALNNETLIIDHLIGSQKTFLSTNELPGSEGYDAAQENDGLFYTFQKGFLAAYKYLSVDFILFGKHLVVFLLTLQEGEDGPKFGYSFGLLNECQARLRMPLRAVDQNQWLYPREGALLKPRCQGERVDLSKVDRLTITIERKSFESVHWLMTSLTAYKEEPETITDPIRTKGYLLDEFGQSALHQWSQKITSSQKLISQLQAQYSNAPTQKFPDFFSRWGGWRNRKVEAKGFFRTHHDGKRWWMVDPDGYLFWSIGLDCVRIDTEFPIRGLESSLSWLPERSGEFAQAFEMHRKEMMFNYLAANFIRTFGAQDWYQKWETITLSELRRIRFNTVANWSDWQIARRSGFPYVRPLGNTKEEFPMVYRDFPDVFHPDFNKFALEYAEPLRETATDPALIGYFLMNEPTWGFAQETPAAGMLFTSPSCYSRRVLADFLLEKYKTNSGLSFAWNLPITFSLIAEGNWTLTLTPTAQEDLALFSAMMVERYFGGLSGACKSIDPNHLNLGIRYYTIPPHWALAGMQYFDVFSMNCYRKRVPADEMKQISQALNQPIMIGEWHFGALDVGLPASGIGHVPDQLSRGKAYRVYIEDAAAKPWCVGAHYFILYDQSALGRFDGENYNIGFFDVCNQPYLPLVDAAIKSHERLYEVASGAITAFTEEPEYLPLLFM